MFIEVFAIDALSKAPMTELTIKRKIWNPQTSSMGWTKTFSPSNATISITDSMGNELFKSKSVEGKNGTFAFTYKIDENQAGGDYYITSKKVS